jgi:transaldolase
MKLFLDTANIEQIKEANDLGVIDGVTTNPTLIAKEGRDFTEVVQEICEIVDGPISAEAVSMDAEGIVREAEELVKIHDNVNIKIPMMAEGLKATKICASKEIDVNMTLIFSPNQALLAAKAGAKFISPFVGRLDDISSIGIETIPTMVQIIDTYGFDAEIIVASVRNPLHVVDAALAGAHIATVPYNVLMQMVKHPLTDIGIQRFLDDYEKIPKK